jgi:hypothetical protein
MVAMIWGRLPPVVGRVLVARATLAAPTRPSSCFCGLVRRSRSGPGLLSFQTLSGWPVPVPVPSGAAVVGPRGRCSLGGCCRGGAGGGLVCGAGGAGVGGGVHDGEEVFVLVGGGEDFEVVQAVAGFADERALGVAEGFFAGFGAVGVDGVGPAAGDAGEEVRVRCAAVVVRFSSMRASFSGVVRCWSRFRVRAMMVPARDETAGMLAASGMALGAGAAFGAHGVFAAGAGVSVGAGAVLRCWECPCWRVWG